MKNLIIPMAGKSSRFPNMRPKWLLTHPRDNNYMCTESILGMNHNYFDKIYFVTLKKFEKDYAFMKGFKENLKKLNIHKKTKVVLLNRETSSQPETVYLTIIKEKLKGSLFIKDSDGYFECKIKDNKNYVTYANLSDVGNIDATSKSYIVKDRFHKIANIVEKKVVSEFFSVGGYSFNCCNDFKKYYKIVSKTPGEFYISDIIYAMILDNHDFYGLESKNFKDWGTIKSWDNYKSNYKTIFCDLDGVLVENASVLMKPYIGESKPIDDNIKTINELYNSSTKYIVITTSRPETARKKTVLELKEKKIKYHQLIMGLPHAKRLLVNDFSETNSFPTAEAINIYRNSSDLRKLV